MRKTNAITDRQLIETKRLAEVEKGEHRLDAIFLKYVGGSHHRGQHYKSGAGSVGRVHSCIGQADDDQLARLGALGENRDLCRIR